MTTTEMTQEEMMATIKALQEQNAVLSKNQKKVPVKKEPVVEYYKHEGVFKNPNPSDSEEGLIGFKITDEDDFVKWITADKKRLDEKLRAMFKRLPTDYCDTDNKDELKKKSGSRGATKTDEESIKKQNDKHAKCHSEMCCFVNGKTKNRCHWKKCKKSNYFCDEHERQFKAEKITDDNISFKICNKLNGDNCWKFNERYAWSEEFYEDAGEQLINKEYQIISEEEKTEPVKEKKPRKKKAEKA